MLDKKKAYFVFYGLLLLCGIYLFAISVGANFSAILRDKFREYGSRDSHLVSEPNLTYRLVIDAGSTGSRLYAYICYYNRFGFKQIAYMTHSSASNAIEDNMNSSAKNNLSDNQLDSLPINNNFKPGEVVSFKVSPALSHFKDDPDGAVIQIAELINRMSEYIPQNMYSYTSVSIQATAGMRLLSKLDRLNIINALITELPEQIPFHLDDVAVISGVMEGIYQWIASNYLLNILDPVFDYELCPEAANSLDPKDPDGNSFLQSQTVDSQKTSPDDNMSTNVQGTNASIFTKKQQWKKQKSKNGKFFKQLFQSYNQDEIPRTNSLNRASSGRGKSSSIKCPKIIPVYDIQDSKSLAQSIQQPNSTRGITEMGGASIQYVYQIEDKNKATFTYYYNDFLTSTRKVFYLHARSMLGYGFHSIFNWFFNGPNIADSLKKACVTKSCSITDSSGNIYTGTGDFDTCMRGLKMALTKDGKIVYDRSKKKFYFPNDPVDPVLGMKFDSYSEFYYATKDFYSSDLTEFDAENFKEASKKFCQVSCAEHEYLMKTNFYNTTIKENAINQCFKSAYIYIIQKLILKNENHMVTRMFNKDHKEIQWTFGAAVFKYLN